MRASQAIVHINKIAAAKRQLEAAIRMFFVEEDELAVHTVASAAFRVLRDVYVKKGKVFTSDLMRDGIFYVAKRHSEGKTPEDEVPFLKSGGLFPIIEKIAQQIKDQGENFNRDQIGVMGSPQGELEFWPSKIANFLKHADRDPESHIALDEVENEKILMGACAAYMGLMRMSSPEIDTFAGYWHAKNNRPGDVPGNAKIVVDKLKETPEEHWHQTCVVFIEVFKEGEFYKEG